MTPTHVAIDWGNSALKVGWFSGGLLRNVRVFDTPANVVAALGGGPVPSAVVVSSTSRPADVLRREWPGGLSADWLVLTPATPVPIANAYATPHTLGADRVAAAVAAAGLYPAQPCLVLDLGTCITADYVDAAATFRGGLISPGLGMRLRAMHTFTERLPLLDPPGPTDAWPPVTAPSTRDAMLGGALHGMALELNGLIDHYRQLAPALRVLVCGRDAHVFESRLKPPIFVVSELVLLGLNRILDYNVHLQQGNP